MGHSREAGTQHLAERWGWQAARRDEARVARRLYRNEVVDGVYRLDEGALLDDFFQFFWNFSTSVRCRLTNGEHYNNGVFKHRRIPGSSQNSRRHSEKRSCLPWPPRPKKRGAGQEPSTDFLAMAYLIEKHKSS